MYDKKKDRRITITVWVILAAMFVLYFLGAFVRWPIPYKFLHPAEEIESVAIGTVYDPEDREEEPPVPGALVFVPKVVLNAEQQAKLLERFADVECIKVRGLEALQLKAGAAVIHICYRNGDYESIGCGGQVTWEPNRIGWGREEPGYYCWDSFFDLDNQAFNVQNNALYVKK